MDESQITLQDYESRHQRIREFLIAEGLGALFVYSPCSDFNRHAGEWLDRYL